MRVRRTAAVAALFLSLVLAACGSGSGTADNDRRDGVPAGPEDAGTTDNGEQSNGGTGPGENQPIIPPQTGGDE